MNLELRELSIVDGKEIYDMLQEIGPGENGFGNCGYDVEYTRFADYLIDNLKYSKGLQLKEEHVPQTIYWLFANKRPVGMIKLRAYLNDSLLKEGGHIGYCIRPSERGKGYGNVILGEVLRLACVKGIDKVLITCNENNMLSKKVIEKNGGIMENIISGKCRYWITF